MEKGYMRFTELAVLSFVLSCLSWTVYYVQVGVNSDPVPPFVLLAVGWMFSGGAMAFAYRRSKQCTNSLTTAF